MAAGPAYYVRGSVLTDCGLLEAAEVAVHETDQAVEFVGDFGEAHVDVGHATLVFDPEPFLFCHKSFVIGHAFFVVC
jgi:hypothetical protein